MKKKTFFITFSIFILFFLLGWISIGSENKILISFKQKIPLEARNFLKKTVFFIPNLINENKKLKNKISVLNSTVNSGLNYNDENFPSEVNWYNVRKFYTPYNTSYFPEKKKSYILEKDNRYFIFFESGKIIFFDQGDFNLNKLFFKNIKSNLESNYIENERDNISRLLDVKLIKNNFFVSLLIKNKKNCYNFAILKSNTEIKEEIYFNKIFIENKCFSKKHLMNDIGNISNYDDKILIFQIPKGFIFLYIDSGQIEFVKSNNLKGESNLYDYKSSIIRYINIKNKIFLNFLNNHKFEPNYLEEFVSNDNLLLEFKVLKKISKILSLEKISENNYKIYFLDENKKDILIYEFNLIEKKFKYFDRIIIGKKPDIINDLLIDNHGKLLITFQNNPSIGYLSLSSN